MAIIKVKISTSTSIIWWELKAVLLDIRTSKFCSDKISHGFNWWNNELTTTCATNDDERYEWGINGLSNYVTHALKLYCLLH